VELLCIYSMYFFLAHAQCASGIIVYYIVQRAFLCLVFDFNARFHYIINTVDKNMFLCVNNLS